MNKIKQPRSSQSNLVTTVMTILTLMVWLGTSHQALGQGQWTTNGNDINNTNTGNVGIGITNPNAKLVVIGGNVGLGSNDMETWTQSSAVLESLNTSIFFGQVGDIHLLSNAYHNNGWKYKGTGLASDYYLYNGGHSWRIAPSGTIDTAITWADAMTLNNSGNLGIGTTTPSHRLHVTGNNTAAGGYPVIKLQNTQAGGHSYLLHSGANNVAADFGLFDETDNAYRFYVKGTSGNIGIGTNTPAAKLDVNGNVSFRGGQTYFRQSTGLAANEGTLFNTGGTINNESYFDMSVYRAGSYVSRFGVDNYGRLYLQPGGGNVGIGITGPNYKLDVQGGQVNASGGLCIAGDCKTAWSQVGGGSGSSAAANVSAGQFGANTGGGNFSFPASVLMSSSGGAVIDSGANNRFKVCGPNSSCSLAGEYIGGRIRLSADGSFTTAETAADPGMGGINAPGNAYLGGNVGIKTTSPTRTLSVNGAATSYMSFNEAGAEKVAIGTEAAAPYNRRFIVYDSTAAAYRLVIDNTGNVGIGTTSPSSKLHVAGGGRLDGTGRIYLGTFAVAGARGLEIIEENATTFSIRHHDPSVAWRNIALNPYGGNIGIGTLTPNSARLVISGSAGAEGLDLSSTDQYANLRVIRNTNSSYDKDLYLQFQAGVGSKLHFYSNNSETMTLNAGNVGIGTTTPTAPLDVNGNVNVTGNIIVSGNINAKYQDVAEWVPSRQKLSAGTVVVLDTEQPNHVVASSSTYDTRVAGVVSAQPGVILGEAGENKVMIATTGRVKIKVDATRAPVRIGDLLVTSDREGYAMKSEPISVGKRQLHAPGTLLGKALEPLAKGTGEILVLLSLQ